MRTIKGNRSRGRKTRLDGITFASQGEANRYCELRLLERSGQISHLELQPVFPLIVNGQPLRLRSDGYPNGRRAKYVADFRYVEAGKVVVEDYKAVDTDLSRLKRAILEAQGIDIRIVTPARTSARARTPRRTGTRIRP